MINKEAIMDDLKNRRMNLDDEFYYGCMQCGSCCHDIDIILNPYDLYRLAKYLGLSTEEVIMKYCLWHIGENSKLPVVWLEFTEDGACPFLKQNRCAVQEAKPFVCAAYPLGRAYLPEEDKIVYIRQNTQCGLPYKKQTVREWIFGERDVTYEEEVHKAWTKMIEEMMAFTRLYPDNIVNMLCEMLFTFFYVGYDTETDFLEQLKERKQYVNEMACDVKKLLENVITGVECDGKV